MSKTFYITICSTIIKTEVGAEIVEKEQVMTVRGKKIHYVKPHGDMLLCQILDAFDNALFSAPAHTIKSVWTPTYPEEKPLPPDNDVICQIIPFPKGVKNVV